MPTSVVKTKTDERYWSECKKSVRKSHPKWSTSGDKFYSAVMGCFQRRKHGLGGRKTKVVSKKKKSYR